jgi:endonuclease/exonuclease/phosphatase family metal-dependent hydrolase
MRTGMSGRNGRLFTRALLSVLAVAGAGSAASAQTTVSLSQPTTQVVSATVRGGSYSDKNDQWTLETRSSDNLEYERRALLKFDTENDIPKGAAVTSALLTITVKDGSEDATRKIGAYQTSVSWTENQVTWKLRRTGEKWGAAGGDYGTKLDEETVGNKAGTKVTFDVTPLVKAAVAGQLGSSRYTRIALIDLESSTSESYREYFAPNDSNTASRPVLKVTYGGSTTTSPPPPPPPPPPPSGSTLRVLQWNTHHGGTGTDGVWDPNRLVTWIAKFNPDVISLNEMERNTSWSHNTDEPTTIAALLKQKTGKTWYWKFETLSGATNGIGDMILSRFPIDASSPRLLSGGRSAIDVAFTFNGRTVNFTSTHLHPDSSSYRITEIGELTSWQSGLAEQRIIAGDFNASYTSPENALMTKTYYDSWAEAKADGTAVAFADNPNGNTRNSRIDFIYYSHSATKLTLKSSQVYDTRDSNGQMPSDHRPLMSVFTVQ